MQSNLKPIPQSILIFGAAAHVGGPLTQFLRAEAPHIKLRLATHSADNISVLEQRYPGCEVVHADYLDLPSLERAVAGMQGIFVITPTGTDETQAMTNVVKAVRQGSSVVQIIRILGLLPDQNDYLIPQSLRDDGMGLPIQHPIARRILDESGLPVTHLNVGATFIDGLLRMRGGLLQRRTLVWPERKVPHIDPRDVGEVAARIFLSDNHRHLGQFHTMNNGQDLPYFSEVASLMSDVWGEPIAYDPTREGFFSTYAHLGDRLLNFLWEFFAFEASYEVVWARNDFVERTLGRRPISLRDWLVEHKGAMLNG